MYGPVPARGEYALGVERGGNLAVGHTRLTLFIHSPHDCRLNANDMLDAALEATRINMTAVERKQFYDRHIKQMKLEIDENGDVSIELKR